MREKEVGIPSEILEYYRSIAPDLTFTFMERFIHIFIYIILYIRLGINKSYVNDCDLGSLETRPGADPHSSRTR